MKLIGRESIVIYFYDSEEEANEHEKEMSRDGWYKVYEPFSLYTKKRRKYSKPVRMGTYL